MSGRRQTIEAIYQAAIRRVDAEVAVASALRLEPPGRLSVGDSTLALPEAGTYAISIGKAAIPMIAAVEHLLGDRLSGGIAVSKSPPGTIAVRSTVLIGSHPTPDRRSLAAGEAVLAFARDIPSGALVLCLVSGGGSALVEALRDGVSLQQLRELTSSLLKAGASINELNAVRSRLSRIKAGGLLDALSGRTVVNVVISDVLGDPPSVIASGPAVPLAAELPAEDVLDRYGISFDLPPLEAREASAMPAWFVVANVSVALDAAATKARELGYPPFVLTRSLDGEARVAGRLIGAIVADTAHAVTGFARPVCLLAGGETVVTVRGDGIGGRNTECALAAAIRLSGVEDAAVGFLATDGDDATTGSAGAIVDGETIGANERVAALAALERNDSYSMLEGRGAVWVTGPTGTNVNDLVIALID